MNPSTLSRNILLLTCLTIVATFTLAADYSIKAVPDSLFDNASAILRLEEITIDIKSPGKAVYTNRYAITILNEQGDRYASFYAHYDKLVDLHTITGTLYDADGKELSKVRKKDMKDISGTSGSLMTDDRYKQHNFYHKIYPYTVEYETETEYNGLFYLPQWQPQGNGEISVLSSTLKVSAPQDYEVRFKQFMYEKKPVITEASGKKNYQWQVDNIMAKAAEPFKPDWYKLTPTVKIAPSDFEIEGFKGNMETWQGFGKFIYQLTAGRDALPADVKQTVHDLTDQLPGDAQKIKVLYDYLQKNCRYISVQLGIGGWQPFDAAFVAGKKYGDCKALSNYMVALLKEAGIKANYVLIRGGDDEEDILADFPSNQFNHAIACVPQQTDTVWLECTSQTVASGYMGSFTGNRKALIIREDGGYVVNTPDYSAAQNLQVRNIKAAIDAAGTLTATIQSRYTGMQQDDLHGMIHALTRKEIEEQLKKNMDMATYDISSFDYKEEKSNLPAIEENIKLVVNHYASVVGKRMFVQPDIYTRNKYVLKANAGRKYDIEFTYAFRDVDTVEIALPTGYTAEALPKNVDIANAFGTYQCSYVVEADKIVMHRTYERKKGRFAAADYPLLVKFYDDMYKADHARVVMVKKEG